MIRGQSPPRQETICAGPNRGVESPISGAVSTQPTGWGKWGRIEESSAAIRAREEVPVKRHWAVRDFRTILAESWATGAAPGDPLFGHNRSEGPPISDAISTQTAGRVKRGEIDPSVTAIRARKDEPVHWRGDVRDFRAIMEESRPIY